MGMQFDAAEVHDPRKAGVVVNDHFLGGASRWEGEGHSAKPLRTVGRRALLIEGFGLRAVDESLENDGPILNALQRSRGDREVILDEIQFR